MKFLAPTLLLYLTFLLDDLAQTGAHAFRISGRWIPPAERRQHGLARRATMSSSGDLNNNQDLKYFTNITLNEEVFPVLIDTGRCAHPPVAPLPSTDPQ